MTVTLRSTWPLGGETTTMGGMTCVQEIITVTETSSGAPAVIVSFSLSFHSFFFSLLFLLFHLYTCLNSVPPSLCSRGTLWTPSAWTPIILLPFFILLTLLSLLSLSLLPLLPAPLLLLAFLLLHLLYLFLLRQLRWLCLMCTYCSLLIHSIWSTLPLLMLIPIQSCILIVILLLLLFCNTLIT